LRAFSGLDIITPMFSIFV